MFQQPSIRRGATAAFIALALAGCSSAPGSLAARLTERGRLLADGPPAVMTPAAIDDVGAQQAPILYAFARQANVRIALAATADAQQAALAALAPSEWTAVTRAGQAYIDSQCYRFLAALNDLERARTATLANLNAVQSATVGIMGLARAAQQSIGYVGIAFGLVASVFDTTTSAYLYSLPAPGVASVVAAQRAVLRSQDTGAATQAEAGARLAEYIQYCVPITIEANIAKLLSTTRARGGDIEALPVAPAVTSALAHGAPFLQTALARTRVVDRVAQLTPTQALAVLGAMLPLLPTRPPATQARLRPLVTAPGGPLATARRASITLNLWAQTETMTPETEAEWLAALERSTP